MLRLLPSRANSTSPCWALFWHCSVSLRGQEHKDPKAFPNQQCLSHLIYQRLAESSCFPRNSSWGAEQGRRGDGGAELLVSAGPWAHRAAACLSSSLPSQYFPHPPAKRTLRAASCPSRAAPESTACTHRVTTGAKTLPTAQQGLRRARRGGALEHTWSTSGILGAPQGGQLPSSCRAEG